MIDLDLAVICEGIPLSKMATDSTDGHRFFSSSVIIGEICGLMFIPLVWLGARHEGLPRKIGKSIDASGPIL
ncbi:MAG: hypothetical protein D6723_04570 [Acidobacteria bacterium]|nr:MAG: hypothetical protein D6723_04570 [Acidobacteriota bacterium]